MSYLLGITSMSMLLSIFSGNVKIIGIGLTLWTITVFWNLYLTLNSSNIKISDITSEINNKYLEAKCNKKYKEQLLYGATIPMIGVGIFMIVFMLISMIFIL